MSHEAFMFLKSIIPFYGDEVDPHQADTPRRMTSMMRELTTPKPFEFTVFPNDGIDEMIVVSPIQVYSLCAHHVIPFHGQAHVAYVPQDKIAGLSKLVRAVKYHMRGLWVQEELTKTIADTLTEKLEPIGVAVVIKAEHMCMSMRGVQSPGTTTTTSVMRGCFRDPTEKARDEFFQIVNNGNR